MICKAEVRMIDFMVHFESDYGPAINFSVYPIVDCVNVNTGVSSIEYIDKTDDCWGTIEYFDEKIEDNLRRAKFEIYKYGTKDEEK